MRIFHGASAGAGKYSRCRFALSRLASILDDSTPSLAENSSFREYEFFVTIDR
jgi:hypothetical protein